MRQPRTTVRPQTPPRATRPGRDEQLEAPPCQHRDRQECSLLLALAEVRGMVTIRVLPYIMHFIDPEALLMHVIDDVAGHFLKLVERETTAADWESFFSAYIAGVGR